MVFVFGSNLAGIHGAGAALEARRRGYPLHLGVGPAADCYAIPTKDCAIKSMPLVDIKLYVDQFLAFAELMEGADIKFQITRIGCGLAGYKDEQIAPMFFEGSRMLHCYFDTKWIPWLTNNNVSYWGTF